MDFDKNSLEHKSSIEKQKKYLKEKSRLKELERIYRKMAEDGTLSLNIDWIDDITMINLDFSQLSDDYKSKDGKELVVCWLLLDKTLSKMGVKIDKVYPKDNLWCTRRQSWQITRLIEFVDQNNPIAPPVIFFTSNECGNIIDGNHRIALSRYLALECVPMLIRQSQLEYVQDLLCERKSS